MIFNIFIICNKKKFPGFWLVQLDSRRRLWITTMPGSWNVKIQLNIQNNPQNILSIPSGVSPHPLAQQRQLQRTAVIPLIVTLLEMVTLPTLSTAENIGTVTGFVNTFQILWISWNFQRWDRRALSLPWRPSNWETGGFRSRLHGLQLSGITRRNERRG